MTGDGGEGAAPRWGRAGAGVTPSDRSRADRDALVPSDTSLRRTGDATRAAPTGPDPLPWRSAGGPEGPRASPTPRHDGTAGWWGELRATLALGLPLIGAQLAQIAINATDTLMMGRLGPAPLGAGGLATTLQFLFVIVGIGITAAVGVMIAQERGARPHAVRGPRRSVRQGFLVVTVLALAALLVLWNGPATLRLLGQDADLAERAGPYFRTAMWSVPFALWFLVLRAFVSAMERPLPILVVTLGAILANAGLNWVLMFGNLGAPALGLRGAGIATTIVNAAMFAALALFVARDRRLRRFRLAGRFWRADPERLAQLVRIGGPIAGLLLAEVGAFATSTLLAGRVGATTLAAHLIALQIASVAFMVPLGLSQATTIRVGLAHGRRDASGTALAGAVSLGLGLGFSLLVAALFILAPGPLVMAFTGEEGGEVVALASSFLFFAAMFKFVDAGQVVLAGALRGLGDTAWPLAAGLVGYWMIGLPVGAALAFGWLGPALGGDGVWIGLATGLAVVFVLLLWRWRMTVRAGGQGAPAALASG